MCLSKWMFRDENRLRSTGIIARNVRWSILGMVTECICPNEEKPPDDNIYVWEVVSRPADFTMSKLPRRIGDDAIVI